MLTYLVYEKQQRLRLMMKMHGLKDAPYWLISYAYFLALSAAYMAFFTISGSIIGNQTTTLLDLSDSLEGKCMCWLANHSGSCSSCILHWSCVQGWTYSG